MALGKLYDYNNDFLVDVNYTFHNDTDAGWWGELVPRQHRPILDDTRYIIELADGRRGGCSLHKRVNRATMGAPSVFVYNFRGRGLLR
jgi:hypothetical protein